ncbi:hypothetical protein [Arthrobacter psychrolactophilus]
MKDPKSTLADSSPEPAASSSTTGLIPAPDDYQFASRKARRQAELTGMIPIIVPKNTAAKESSEPVKAEPKDKKNDGVTDPVVLPTDTVGPVSGGSRASGAGSGQDQG